MSEIAEIVDSLPSGVTLRRYSPEHDLTALARLLAGTPETATPGEDISQDALRAQYAWPGHDPARDRWVLTAADEPNHLAGYASTFKSPATPRADLLLVVHPAWRGRGFGSALLRLALADARALGASDAACYVDEADAPATHFALTHGFTPVSAYTRLTAPGAHTFPPPTWPEGFTVRACRGEDDLPLFAQAANECFADLWGHNTVTAEDAREWFATRDPEGVFFLFAPDGALAGRSLAQRIERAGQRVGLIDAPGIVPAWRYADLYAPLLLQSIAWLAQQPVDEFTLESWGDSPVTLAAYRALGFTLARREVSYRLPLR